MKREYASVPPTTSITQLSPTQAEVILREDINSYERPVYDGEGAGKTVTVFTAEEYTVITTYRDNLEASVEADREGWLEMAKAAELEALRPEKLVELSEACYAAIVKGFAVELADGSTEHFAMEETDQINLTAALAAVEQGAPGYPYHADGQLCRIYTAADITTIAKAATAHKMYHTTYCNHAMTWARRAKTGDELAGIYYGATLPEDLAENMAEVLSSAESD